MTCRGAHSVLRSAARVVLTLIVAALALGLVPRAAVARDDAVPISEYIERVGRARDMVQESVGKKLDDRQATDLAIQVNSLVPLSLDVETPDGVVTANHSLIRSLVARLDSTDEVEERMTAVEELDAQLTSLASAIGRPGDAVPEDPEALSELLGEQAAREPSALQRWLLDVVDRIGRALMEWWASLNDSPGGRTAVTFVVYGLLIGLGLLLLYLFVRLLPRVRAGTARRHEAPAPPSGEDAVVVAARDLPADALAYADERAAAGDMREAIRALFGGAARALQERGYVVEARTRTNRELLLEIRPRSEALHVPLSALSAEFERVWYGHRDLLPEGYSAARARYVDAQTVLDREGGERS